MCSKVNREVRKKTNAAKEEWTEKLCKHMKKRMMSGSSKEAYNTLKALTKAQQHQSSFIKTAEETSLWKAQLFKTKGLSTVVAYPTMNEFHPDTSLFQSNESPTQEEKSLPVLREEV